MPAPHFPAVPLRGIVPPLITPLRSPDELDRPALSALVEHVLAGGVAGLFVLGTTGEGPALSYRLRYELIEVTCELVAGRVPVLVGVTDPAFSESLDMSRHAADCGAAAVVAAPPYYHPLRPDDIVHFFVRLAESSPLPVFLYNIPPCAHAEITPAMAAACTPIRNIVGIKDSSGDLANFQRLLELRRERPDWSFLMGPEHLLAEATLAGGDGGVHGGANLDPRLFVELFEAASNQAAEGATSSAPSSAARHRVAALQERARQLGRLYEIGGDFMSVARGLKCALSQLGICQNLLTEPLRPYDAEQTRLVAKVVASLGLATPIAIQA